MNILFVCSKNKWRSRTAETIFKNSGQNNIRSAGTENGARVRISEPLLNWADLIFVMEEKHQTKIERDFPDAVEGKIIVVLGIEDDYKYMDAELIETLKITTEEYL